MVQLRKESVTHRLIWQLPERQQGFAFDEDRFVEVYQRFEFANSSARNVNLPLLRLSSISTYAATGMGTLAKQNNSTSVTMDISGLVCNTESGLEVFNGSYVVTGGSGKYSSASGGTGAISGSQNPASSDVGNSQVTVNGSIQQTVP